METDTHPRSLASFVRAVGVLAASAEQQCAWLDSLVPAAAWSADELAMEFDDGFRLSEQWIRAGWLPEQSRVPMAALDEKLGAMSGPENGELWTRTALATHDAWQRVRVLATDVLMTLT